MKTVHLLDYGVGNIGSLAALVGDLGAVGLLAVDPAVIERCAVLILPGVGSAFTALRELAARDLLTPLAARHAAGRPIVGICLGAQLLFEHLDEAPGPGLGFLPGNVAQLAASAHFNTGWCQLDAGAVAGLSDLDEIREVLSGLLHGPGRVVVASSIRIRSIGPVRPLGDDIEERIATEWQGALVERPTMTDDEIVAVDAWRLARDVLDVEVSLTHYRTYVAQRRGVPVGIVPLGVSGVVRLDSGGLVPGKRSQDVTQYAGFWEFIPSGGVSRKRMADDGVVDATGQLLEELREELGISTDRVRRVLPLGLIEDVADRVIDLAYAIDLSATVEELQRGILQRGEYVEVQVLCASEIEKLLSTGRSTIAPTVMPLLKLLRVKAPVLLGSRLE
jgi:hypothetical protein